MFFLRKLIYRMVFVWLLGWVVRKLRGSENPKLKRVGEGANRAMGGTFGLMPNDPRFVPRRRRGRSLGSAAVGGLMSYFADPVHGRERRERAKSFATEKINRARSAQRPALPAPTYSAAGAPSPVGAPNSATIT